MKISTNTFEKPFDNLLNILVLPKLKVVREKHVHLFSHEIIEWMYYRYKNRVVNR